MHYMLLAVIQLDCKTFTAISIASKIYRLKQIVSLFQNILYVIGTKCNQQGYVNTLQQ